MGRLVVLLAVVLAAGLGVFGRLAEAQEKSLEGDFLLQFEFETIRGMPVSYGAVCLAAIEKDESELNGALACSGFDNGRFTGVVRPDDTLTITMEQWDGVVRIAGMLTDNGFDGDFSITKEGEDVVHDGIVYGFPWPARWGDMNCDGSVNSIDAWYILADDSEACRDDGGSHPKTTPNLNSLGGDGNLDGRIDSRDALLILQVEAGLIERLPVL